MTPCADPSVPAASAPEVLESLLACLERYRDHPSTLPLHDALFRLLREPAVAATSEAGREVLAALEGGHPIEDEVRTALGLPPAPRARDLAQILAQIPDLPAREDPLEALELYLAAQRERIALLERARLDLDRVAQRQGVLLSAAVGGATLLLILMAVGWGLAPLWLGPGGPSASDVPQSPRESAREDAAGDQGDLR